MTMTYVNICHVDGRFFRLCYLGVEILSLMHTLIFLDMFWLTSIFLMIEYVKTLEVVPVRHFKI